MNKILMTIAAVLCCWVTLYAQPLTEQEAKERVLQYMNSGKAPANARRMAAPAQGGHMKLEAIPVEAEKVYAFNMEGGGFVIASGDQRTLPVLGYSTTGSIDGSRMPENMRSWLKHYDDAIATLGDRTDFEEGGAHGHRPAHQKPLVSDRAVLEPVADIPRCQSRSARQPLLFRLRRHGDGAGDELL